MKKRLTKGCGFDLEEVQRLLVEERQRQLEEAIGEVGDAGVEIAARVYVGDPVDTIVEAVQNEGYDLLMKSFSPVQGLRQQMFGCIDLRLMRACPCPVSRHR